MGVRKLTKGCLIIAIVSLFLAGWVLVRPVAFLQLISSVLSGEQVVAEVPSPDGRFVAMATVSSASPIIPFGGTVPFEMDVQVREGQGWFGISTLRFGIGEDKWILATHGDQAKLKWVDENTLLVEYNGSTYGTAVGSWKDIRFVYRSIGQDSSE